MVCGFLLVTVVCLLALKDENDENGHEKRLKKYEQECGVPFEKVSFPRIPSGTVLMWIAISVVHVFNVVVLVVTWSHGE